MKSALRRGLFAFVAIVIAFNAVSRNVSAEDALRYKFTAGEKLSYTMTQEMEMAITPKGAPNAIKTSTNQSTEMIWHIVEVNEDGSAVIDQSMERVQMKVTGPGGGLDFDSKSEEDPEGPIAAMVAPMLKTLAGATFRVTVSPRGEITDVQVPEAVTAAMAKAPGAAQMGEMFTKEGFKKMIQQSSVTFPEKPLTPGVEWTRSMVMKNPGTGGQQTIESKYRYEGKEEVDGKSLDKFGVQLTLDFGEGPGATKITIESQGSQGTIYFDREVGRMRSASIDMAMDMQIVSGGNTLGMHLDQTVTTKVEPFKE